MTNNIKKPSTLINSWCKKNDLNHYTNDQLDYLFDNIQWIYATENFNNFDLLKSIIEISKQSPFINTLSNNLLHYMDVMNTPSNIKKFIINNFNIKNDNIANNLYKLIHILSSLSNNEISIFINTNYSKNIFRVSSSLLNNEKEIIFYIFVKNSRLDNYKFHNQTFNAYGSFNKYITNLIYYWHQSYKDTITKEKLLTFLCNNSINFNHEESYHNLLKNIDLFNLLNKQLYDADIEIVLTLYNNNFDLVDIIKILSKIKKNLIVTDKFNHNLNFDILIKHQNIFQNLNCTISTNIFLDKYKDFINNIFESHDLNKINYCLLLFSVNDDFDIKLLNHIFNNFNSIINSQLSLDDNLLKNFNLNDFINYFYITSMYYDKFLNDYKKTPALCIINLTEIQKSLNKLNINNHKKIISWLLNQIDIDTTSNINIIYNLIENIELFNLHIDDILDNNINASMLNKFRNKNQLFQKILNNEYSLVIN